MNRVLVVSSLLLSFTFAEAHDWRTDKAAFKSARIDSTFYAAPNPSQMRTAINISQEDIQTKMKELTGITPVMLGAELVKIPERGGEAGRKLARAWLSQEYQKLGYSVSEHKYGKGSNFIAEKKGASGKVLIVSSHFDSVGNSGADDDGMGTVGALLFAKGLSDVKLEHTLRFLAFDQEESGLVGSRAYTKTLDSKEILGDIQMEMLGYNSRKDGHFHIIDCDRTDSLFLTQAIMKSIQSLGIPLTRVSACTERSDHASFWENDMPAVVISENFFGGDGDRCYHRKCDVFDERLDLKYASLILTGIVNAIRDLVQD